MSSTRVLHRRHVSKEPPTIQQELDEIERLKSGFIRNVSHELRTPLACIDGFARALMQLERQEGNSSPAASERRRQFLSIISQEAQRLGKLIEDVLDLSDVQSKSHHHEAEQFNAKELFEDVLDSLTANDTLPKVLLRLKPEAEASAEAEGPPIYADRASMIEVIRELLSNAKKHSGAPETILGAELVSIGPDEETQASESGMRQRVSGATQLYVKDSGQGIAKEDLPHVFEKFYRGKRAISSSPGMGLGLSIVRELVSQNGGRIWVDSVPGFGATFYILLPSHAPGEG